jgi:hypothetical protein
MRHCIIFIALTIFSTIITQGQSFASKIVTTSITLPVANSNRESLTLSRKRTFNIKKVSIGEIRIGMSEYEVISKLGYPKSKKIYSHSDCVDEKPDRITILKYDGLSVKLLKRERGGFFVDSITTKNRQYSTNTEIKVGDSINKVRETYLETVYLANQSSNSISFSDPKFETCAIVFEYKYGHVTLIKTDCGNACF